MAVQVLLADDHRIVRDGLKVFLEKEGFHVCGEAEDGQQAVWLAEQLHPDVAVLDISMPKLNGLDVARELGRVTPRTKTIILTMHGEKLYILQGLRAGIRAFVMKTHAADDLVKAIHEALRGGTYLSPEVSGAVVCAYQSAEELSADPLSPRERQVLQLIAEGRTSKEIADVLNISVKTVETHRGHVMQKLDIHEIAGLVRFAIRRGLIRA